MSEPATLLLIDGSKVDALITALNRVADNQDQLLAGQEAVKAVIEGQKPTRTRTKKAEDTPAAAAAEEAAPAAAAATEQVKSYLPEFADADALKAYVMKWTGEVTGDDNVKRVGFLKAIAAHFGVAAKFSELLPHAKETAFFIERYKAGTTDVDFNLAYDFDGDPAQVVEAGSTSSDDDFG